MSVDDLAKGLGTTGAKLKDSTVDAKKLGDAITDAVIKKGADPLKRLGSSFAEIKGKFMSNIGDMFEDIDVGPFMEQVKSLFSIFSQSKSSGEAMKAGIGGFFKEVFDDATKLVPLVKHFLLDVVIWGLKAYIAVKPLVQTVKDFFASATGSSMLKGLLDGLLAAFAAVAIVVGVVVAVFALFGAFLVLVSAGIGSMIGSIVSLGATITGFVVNAAKAFAGWVASALQIGTDFVAGLVKGITDGAGTALAAVTKLGDSVVGAVKGIFQTHSPSKVMFGIGGDVTDGLTGGIDGGAVDVHGAASDMAKMAVSGASAAASTPIAGPAAAAMAAASAGASGGGGGGGVNVTIEAGAIAISGQGKDWAEVTEEMIEGVMERLALSTQAA